MNTQVLIDLETSSPVAFLNVYEDGDEWEKTKGCDECPEEQRILCCGGPIGQGGACHFLREGGKCYWQNIAQTPGVISQKSLYCMCTPTPKPDDMHSPCVLEYKCVKGSSAILGKVRRVSDKRRVLIDAQPIS